jgi:hypothetical protein
MLRGLGMIDCRFNPFVSRSAAITQPFLSPQYSGQFCGCGNDLVRNGFQFVIAIAFVGGL